MNHIGLLLVILACASCNRYNKNISAQPTNKDSMILYMRQTVNYLIRHNKLHEASQILDSLKSEINKSDDYKLAGAWLRVKTALSVQGEHYDTARYYAVQALQLAHEKDSSKKEIAAADIQFADLLKEVREYDSALIYAKEAYYYFQKVDTSALVLTCLRLAEIYRASNDPDHSRQYLFEGFSRSSDPVHKAVFISRITNFYGDLKQTDSAIYFLKKIEKDTSLAGSDFDATTSENLGILLTQKSGGKEIAEGLRYQLKAAALYRSAGQIDAQSYFNLAATYRKLKQYNKSNAYLDTSMAMASPKDWTLKKQIWLTRARNDAGRKSFFNAFSAMDSAYAHFGTEVDSTIILRAQEVETKYNVRSKEDEIASLALKNKLTEKVNKEQRVSLFALSAAILLLGMVGVLFWRRRQLQTRLREIGLQQQLLRTQIEPHFIYNSLNILLGFIRSGHIAKAIRYVSKFGRLLRLSLENARSGFVSLRKEIDALDSYLALQAISMEEKFEYKIDMYNSYENDEILIPPMLLQPFAENAIVHGIAGMDTGGLITIQVKKHAGILHCTIEDNGAGFQRLTKDKDGQPLSSIITKERLALLSRHTGHSASLSIRDKSDINGQGIIVTLEIPFVAAVRKKDERPGHFMTKWVNKWRGKRIFSFAGSE